MSTIFSEDQKEIYNNLLANLDDLEDEAIVSENRLPHITLLHLLALKHKIKIGVIQEQLCVIGPTVYWDSPQLGYKLALYPLEDDTHITLDFVYEAGGQLVFEGQLSTVLSKDNVRIVAKTEEGALIEGVIDTNCSYDSGALNGKAYLAPLRYVLSVPFKSFSIFITLDGSSLVARFIFGKYCPLTCSKGSYAHVGRSILTSVYPYTKIEISPDERRTLLRRELLAEVRAYANYHEFWRFVGIRRKAFFSHLQNNKRIWLISDRPDLANDNGEALFEYLQVHPIDGVETFFVLRDDSVDYKRLCEIGSTLPYGSDQHLQKFLEAEAVLSSAADDSSFNPFFQGHMVTNGFSKPLFVFLQHGITVHDISAYLNRFGTGIDLFITAAQREKESIVKNLSYGYKDSQVACTGFSRHDKLLGGVRDTKKILLIAPTWRNKLAMPTDERTDTRPANPLFTSSHFFRFFNRLLNDRKLINAAKENDYSIRFLVHPSLRQESEKFSSEFGVVVSDYDYADELRSASIMLTDYSSIAFDFALQKKPVIYTQFDKDDFYASQIYDEGYFNYERDGFGPVVTEYDETVDALVDCMRQEGMPSEYIKRSDEFFYWPDCLRCEKICQAILDALKEQKGRIV